MEKQFHMLYCRSHVSNKNEFLICGLWRSRAKEEVRLVASLDYTPLALRIEKRRTIKSPNSYVQQGEYEETLYCFITLPEDFENYHKLRMFEQSGTSLVETFSVSVSRVRHIQEEFPFNIDEAGPGSRGTVIRGWCIAKEGFELEVTDLHQNVHDVRITEQKRPDVEFAFPEYDRDWVHGFIAETDGYIEGKTKITIRCDGKEKIVTMGGKASSVQRAYERIKNGFLKVKVYYQRFGLKKSIVRAYEKCTKKEIATYEQFRRRYMPDRRELQRQRKKKFAYEPKFAIVVPLYKTPLPYPEELIRSIKNQTYTNWELYLSDGSGPNSPLEKALEEYEAKDKRIHVIYNQTSLRIADNTNKALEKAEGDFIVFTDHDDMLSPDALYECARAVNISPETEMLYSDEDKVSMDGREYYQPHFKSDFNLDLLRSRNYICHLCVVKKQLFDRVGYLRSEYDGSQDYDFILRCAENTDKIVHIPKVLYHWRIHPNSVAGNPQSKNYAYESGKRAINAHYRRLGIDAEVEMECLGIYRTIYHRTEEPLVSIIIPNKDHEKDLKRCINSVQEKSSYRNFEIFVVENNSEGEEIKEYYSELEKTYDNVNIIYYKGGFNYSSIHNYVVPKTNGEYILFLNNDTWIKEKNSIREMVSYCMRNDVGVVGARLLYPDDTIQHAGVIVGLGGAAGHAFVGVEKENVGYFGRIICAQDYSAVTAACMLVKKSVYEEVGGMETELAVAFGDTDFCLRVREKGYLVVYQPNSIWYHDESKTRGAEDNEEKLERFRREVEFFQRRWGSFMEHGDPYYNPNLALDRSDFSLRG